MLKLLLHARLFIVALLLAHGARAQSAIPTPLSEKELAVIRDFADRLFDLIQHKDAKGYAAYCAHSEDQFADAKSGKSLDKTLGAIGWSERTIEDQFVYTLGNLEKLLSDPKEITIKEVKYFAWSGPHFEERKLGALKFDLFLFVRKGEKIRLVEQPGCALTIRGVLACDAIIIPSVEINDAGK